jgi:hypothetical protein
MSRFLKNLNKKTTYFSLPAAYFKPLCSPIESRAKIYRWKRSYSWKCDFLRNRLSQPASNTTGFQRQFSSKHPRKNFYKILGVSTKATQGQIKAAYYNLSLKHHPDRHEGSQEAHGMFQQISEAYGVLGSLDSRKQYDRSLIVEGLLSPEQARPFHAPPRPTASIYDFDEWAKQHYYEALLRKQRDKKERKDEEIDRQYHKLQEGSFRLVCFAVFLAIFVAGILLQNNTLEKSEVKTKE